jgi:pimeloyl-ACP methyl ester carboxylesterase
MKRFYHRNFLVMVAATLLAVAGGLGESAQAQTRPKQLRPAASLPLTSFYDTRPLTPGKPGELIRSETVNQYNIPYELSALRILYHSRTTSGADVAVSGVVLIPDGKPPTGGWPVIAWAHDFRGAARQCAPSLMKSLDGGPVLAMYASLGYAVVATDYAGLGADSGPPVVDMRSNAMDVMYSVPAARAAVPQIGRKWIAVGPFEGAMAAIAIAEGQERDSDYMGSIATSGLADAQEAYERIAQRTPSRMLVLASTVKTLFPEFAVSEMLKDAALPAYQRAAQKCIEDTDTGIAGDSLRAGWENNKFVKEFFDRNTPGQTRTRGPLLVISGETDSAIPVEMTEKSVARMCKQGDRVEFLKYPNLDASGVMGVSAADQISWIKARFAGDPAPSNCP